MKESDLILQLKEGNKEAFTSIYKKYWKEVYNFTRLYIKSVADSEEIVQDVFVKVWETHNKINEAESFQGLLFIITRNIIFNKQRDSLNKTFLNYTILNAFVVENQVDEEIDAGLLKEYIQTLLNQLTPRQQEIFFLSRNQHLSYKQIAQHLNIKEKTVERHINDALRHLRNHLPYLILLILVCSLLRNNRITNLSPQLFSREHLVIKKDCLLTEKK